MKIAKDTEYTVKKRTEITNNTLEEINNLYPRFSKRGIEYTLGQTYVTVEADSLDEPTIRKLLRKYGGDVIAVIIFFRLGMCQPYGWYLDASEDNIEMLISDCAYKLKLEEARVKEILDTLIESKIFWRISDNKGTYLANIQNLYTYEILNTKRLRDRERKNADKNNKRGKQTSADDSASSQTKPQETQVESSEIKEIKEIKEKKEELEFFDWDFDAEEGDGLENFF